MQIGTEQLDDDIVLTVEGNITMGTAPDLHEAINKASQSGIKRILVDLSSVAYMDSSGVGVLVSGFKLARGRDIFLGLCGITQRVMAVIELTGLTSLFEIYPNLETARRAP